MNHAQLESFQDQLPYLCFSRFSDIEWLKINAQESAILQSLPHGSGINLDWTINHLGNGKIQAFNSYHVMSEYGFYIGWADFSITLDPSLSLEDIASSFRLCFHGSRSQYLARYYDLRSYLEDTLVYCIETAREKI